MPETALDEARRLLAAAEALVKVRRRMLNHLLPPVPADLLADLEEEGEQAGCPVEGCQGRLYAYAPTEEVSPVLGWGPSDQSTGEYKDSRPVFAEVTALWLGDYDYSDSSGEIDTILCTAHRGHQFQVPDHLDRNV